MQHAPTDRSNLAAMITGGWAGVGASLRRSPLGCESVQPPPMLLPAPAL